MVKRRLSDRLRWLAIILIAGVLAGCATAPPPIVQHGSGIVPTSSLEDLMGLQQQFLVEAFCCPSPLPVSTLRTRPCRGL